MTHRVAVVGSVRLFREGVAALLRATDKVEVVVHQSIDDEALSQLSKLTLDVILVSVMSQADCAQLRAIVDAGAGARLVAIAVPLQDDLIIACAEAGFSGYVPAGASIEDLVRAIDGVVHGQPPIPLRLRSSSCAM
jgi:two-component system, NarL family, nitrate/nitrite response regulator NarL